MSDAPAIPDRTAIDDLLEVMSRLRDPVGGCPWDLAQSFESIAPYTIEEAYEVADAIATGDMDLLEDELGDLLLQVVFYAQMSSERGGFTFNDIARRIVTKMQNRHPHVFGPSRERSSSAAVGNWEAQKSAEREERARRLGRTPSALDGVANALPALMRAQKLQRRAANVGFDWMDPEDVIGKVLEEVDELQSEMAGDPDETRLREECGDLLFACVNLVRKLGVDAEVALREANEKFSRRFHGIEKRLAEHGREPAECSLPELEAFWQEVKRSEPGTP